MILHARVFGIQACHSIALSFQLVPGVRVRLPYAATKTWQRLSGSTRCVLTVTGRIPDGPRSADLRWLALLHVPARIASGRPRPTRGWHPLIAAAAAAAAAHMASRLPEAPMCCWCLEPALRRAGDVLGEGDPLARSVGCAGCCYRW